MASAYRNWRKSLKNNTARKATRRPLLEELETRVMPAVNSQLDQVLQQLPLQKNLSANTPVLQAPGAGLNVTGITVSAPVITATADQSPGPSGYTPAQIRAAYGFNQLPGTGAFSSDSYDTLGSGQTIAIIDYYDAPTMRSDLQAFDETFNINGTAGDSSNTSFFTEVNEYGGGTLPSTQNYGTETALDVEWAHAIAPGANILLVEADSPSLADLDTAVETAANYPGVSVVSMSFGTGVEFASEYLFDSIFTTPLGHQGETFVAAAGDSGGVVQYPSVSPNVLSVGGTTLTTDVSGDYLGETGWSNSGGGVSDVNGIFDTPVGEGQPAYQQGVVDNANTGFDSTFRATPDVAYDADPNTGFSVYDAFVNGSSTPWDVVGGTSAAAPQWAALIAIANEGRAAQGESTLDGPSQLLPAIYQIGTPGSPLYDSNAFNNITTGNNGYAAGSGYNLVTGLGTPNAQNLVPDLVNAYPTPAAPQTVYWTGDAGDNNWNDPGNWLYTDPQVGGGVDGVLPGPSSNVVIDVPNATINIGEGAATGYAGTWNYDTISSLTVTSTGTGAVLFLQDGTLDLSGGGGLGLLNVDQSTNEFLLIGGVLKNAEVTSNTTITVFGYEYTDTSGNELDGVQLDGTLDLSQSYEDYFVEAYAQVQDGLTLNGGTILLGNSSGYPGNYYSFLFMGGYSNDAGALDNNPEVLGGTGTVVFGTSDYFDELGNDGSLSNDDYGYGSNQSQATLTIGSGITIDCAGSEDMIGNFYTPEFYYNYYDGTSFDIQGTIVDNGGTYLDVDSGETNPWTNDGSIELSNGAQAFLSGAGWVNNGSISVDSGSDATITVNTPGTGEASWINNGSISVDGGSDATISGESSGTGSAWINSGTGSIYATNGSTLDLSTSWTNYGTISVDVSTVDLGEPTYGESPENTYDDVNFLWSNPGGIISITDGSTADLGGFFTTDTFESLVANGQSLAGDTVTLMGSLDNTIVDNPVSLGVLTLNDSTGPLYLDNDYIDQGTIVTDGGNDLVGVSPTFDTYYSVFLNDVTLDGELDLSQAYGVSVYVTNGLTLNGTILLGGGADNSASGFEFLNFGNYDDNVPETVSGTGTIQLGQDYNSDFIQNDSNETLTFGPGITIEGGLYSYIYASDYGSLSAIDIQGTIEENTAFTAASTGDAYVGTLQVFGTIANYDSATSTLSGGTWEVGNGASLELLGVDGVNITTNAATINVSGAGSEIYSDYGVTDALAGFTDNAADGSFIVGNGYTFTAPGDFSNAGVVDVQAGGDFTTGASDYVQSSGAATVDGELDAANVVLFSGSLTGAGTVQGEVYNSGTVDPGDGGTGILTIIGDYAQNTTGTLDIAIGDHSQTGTFGQLAISGNASLDGALNVSVAGGFTPSPGDDYTILTFNSQTGDFASETGLTLSSTLSFNQIYDTTDTPNNLTLYTAGTPTITVTGGPFVYDGLSPTPTITLTGIGTIDSHPVGSMSVTYTYPGGIVSATPPVNAGTYQVNVAFTSDDPNYASATGSGFIVITPLALTVTAAVTGKTYDGTTDVAANDVTLSSNALARDNLVLSFGSASYLDPNAGSGKTVTVNGITISGSGASNYTFNTTAIATANITPVALSVTGITANSKVYNSTTSASLNLAGATLVGVQGSDAVALSTAGATGVFASANVGTGIVVSVDGLTISGTTVTAGDYTLTQPTTTANITSRALTVSGITANNQVYDSSTTASLNLGGATLVGVQGSDAVTLSTTLASGAFASANVGSGKPVTITGLTISGATVTAGDYTLTLPATTASITPATLTVSGITAGNKVYNATTSASLNLAGATLVGVQGSDAVTLSTTGATGAFATGNAGSGIVVTVAGLTVSGAAVTAGDYTLTQPTTTANITPRALTVSGITANNQVYDSSTTASLNVGGAALVGVQGSDAVTLSTTGATGTFASPNEGTGITVSVGGLAISGATVTAGDYTLTLPTTTANITPATLTVSGITAGNKVYDSTTVASLNLAGATLVGVQGSDAVTLSTTGATGAFATGNAGSGIVVTIAGLTVSGTAVTAGDYTLTQPTTTANITPRTLTVSGITANNQVYDSSTTASLNVGGAALVGVQGSDAVTLSATGATGTFASPNVGTGIAVSVTGLTISGVKVTAGDYTLTQPSTTANITPATLTVSGITAGNKVYDSTTTASLNLTGATLVGVQGGDAVTLSTTGATGAFASANAGTGIVVTVAGLTVSGATVSAGDYTLTQPTPTANITPRTLTVSGITANNQVYDSSTTASLNVGGAALVGVQGSDAVTLGTGSATGTFASKNVGSGIVVTIAGLSISGVAVTAGDYTLTQPTTTANITPATLTVSGITANNKVYNATTPASLNLGGATLVGVQGSDLVSLNTTDATGAFASANVGTGIVVPIAGLSVSGTAVTAGDYTLTQPTTAANITPATLTVTGITANNKVYDSSTSASLNLGGALLAGLQGSDTVSLSTNGATGTFASKDVGNGIAVTIAGLSIGGTTVTAGDYTLTQPTTTADITPATLTVVGITASNKEFDNTTTATVNVSGATLVGVQGSDVDSLNFGSVSGTFDTSAVGNGITVTVAGLSISGDGVAEGDYTLTQPTATANITPPLTWSTPADITYGIALGSTQLDATFAPFQTPAGAFLYSPPLGTVLGVGNQTLSVTFVPTNTLEYPVLTQTVSINVDPAPTSITITPAVTTQGVNGSVTVSVGLGQDAPQTAGTPTGMVSLTVNGGTALTMPLTDGSATFVVGALNLNAGENSLSASYAAQGNFAASGPTTGPQLQVNSLPSLSATSLDGTAAQPFSQTLQATGGTGAITYSVSSGSLPADLSLNPETGAITGTPRTAGSYSFAITATDSLGASDSATISMLVNPASWTIGLKGYSQTISEPGVDTFKLASGSVLPKGLTLNATTGVISGTPSKAGTFTFTINATAVGTTTAIPQTYSVTINPALTITAKTLPGWTLNSANYASVVTTVGGTGAVTFAVTSKTPLPLGLSLDPATGVITGTPSKAGTYTFSITATDSVFATVVKKYTVVVNPALAVTTTSLPTAIPGKSYTQTIKVKGGTGKHTFSLELGDSLPPGLSLNAATGAITGKPTQGGTYTFALTVTDQGGATVNTPVTIFVS